MFKEIKNIFKLNKIMEFDLGVNAPKIPKKSPIWVTARSAVESGEWNLNEAATFVWYGLNEYCRRHQDSPFGLYGTSLDNGSYFDGLTALIAAQNTVREWERRGVIAEGFKNHCDDLFAGLENDDSTETMIQRAMA